MDAKISFTLNGKPQTITTDPDRPLLDVLREDLHQTGTKYGCGEGQCGACTVLVNDKRTFSCRTPCSKADGKTVQTIEGLATAEALHPAQQAFLDEGAFQCGYCTPGMIMATVALQKEKPKPTDDEIRSWMTKNICRCCSYPRITNAVRRACGMEVK